MMWWMWVVAGIVLAIAEVALPGYIFLGFAIGAVVTGILIGIGLLTGSLSWLLLAFGIVSLIAWLVLRLIFRARDGQVKIWTRDINDN